MNSLLNTLKKTEEEKRRRAAQLHQANADADAALVTEPPTELALQLEAEPVVVSEGITSPSTLSTSLEDAAGLTEPLTPRPTPDETPSSLALSDESVTPTLSIPPKPAEAIIAPSINSATMVAAAEPVQPQLRHRQPSGSKPRSLLPWIALGGGVLLAGVVAWVTWQYQQISQGALTPLPRALPPEVASAPAVVEPAAMLAASPEYQASESDKASGYTSKTISSKEVVASTPASILPAPAQKIANKPAASTLVAAPSGADQLRFEKTPTEMNAPIMLAWETYQQRNWRLAEQLYRKILASEPRHRDALLGLAAVHIQQQQNDKASAIYQYLRQLNPQDHEAEQALLALHPERISAENAAAWQQSQPQADSRAANPVLLGQYYASRSNWQQAQEQFFQAWSAQPDNADIAFNLAVSLDHLQQSKLAAEFYQQALTLGSRFGAAFDRPATEARLAQLRLAGF
jgi:tetratricopeptide (TPR) repeat protein